MFTDSVRIGCSVPDCRSGLPLLEADVIKVWTGLKGDDRTSDLDTGQVRIPEVAHPMQRAQQVVSFQIAGARSQCFSYNSTRHLQSLD